MTCLLGLFFQIFAFSAMAQPSLPNLSFELIKPKAYEARTLPSEKTGNKKFTKPRRFYNDLVSRFNYYFNANNKLNDALDQAKAAHQDDYTQLLSFYNYNLTETAKGQMDSIIYKCTAGILLHDLRSDWVDKLYLLMGKAYLYRKDFDSASNVFQYINYAFAPKSDGYDLPIGSNASNTNGIFTISTFENRSLWKKIASFPPSRNESFMLQVRTYIEQDKLVEAGSLLELIRTDPNFPERLQTDFHEMKAYLLYKQEYYGPAADELLLALNNGANKLEKARWEYLAGQLYQLAHQDTKAISTFERSILHTSDPLMEVYARMNIVSLASATQENAIQKNLDELLKMAKRDKYEMHRDIIYYAAAQLELKRKNYAAAEKLLLTSIKSSVSNPLQKQLSFLLLGDMNYPIKKYGSSHKYYDSILTVLLKDEDAQRVTERKPALKIISENQDIITREDSLQKLASLTPEEREVFVKKLLKQLRKEKGLKDAENGSVSFGNTLPIANKDASSNLFGGNGSDFYFQNASVKAKGTVDFKSRWGNRPNVDNWRRQTAVNSSLSNLTNITSNTNEKTAAGGAKKEPEKELSIESLNKDIPLTKEQTDNSSKAILKALMTNALTFQNMLEDYPTAIETYEEILKRFPESGEVEQTLFNLAYCYKKNGNGAKSDELYGQLKNGFPNGKYVSQLNSAITAAAASKKTDPAQEQYQNVYNLFLSGKFDEAKEAKNKADKQFGKNYWTPQLLYIESIYYIKKQMDSTAVDRLQNIVTLFPKSPLAVKAATMIDVLYRRPQIEKYLTELNLDKPQDGVSRAVDLNSTSTITALSNRKKDTVMNIPKEIKTAPKQLVDLTDTKTITAAAPIKKDSITTVMPKEMKKLEISNIVTAAPNDNKTYQFNPADTQYVVVVLNNVDPIFVTEGRNAFNRYNQDMFADKKIELYNRRINAQYTFLMIGPFANAGEAITYIDRTRPLTKTRIVPWLTADKYSFSMISNANMEILISKQDIEGYHTFIQKIFPDKF